MGEFILMQTKYLFSLIFLIILAIQSETNTTETQEPVASSENVTTEEPDVSNSNSNEEAATTNQTTNTPTSETPINEENVNSSDSTQSGSSSTFESMLNEFYDILPRNPFQ